MDFELSVGRETRLQKFRTNANHEHKKLTHVVNYNIQNDYTP